MPSPRVKSQESRVKSHYFLVSPLDYGAVADFGLTYSSPVQYNPGDLVEIPLGRKTSFGVVVGPVSKPDFATKPISSLVRAAVVPPHLVELAQWLAGYYCSSPKAVWQTMLPRGLLKTRRDRPARPHALELPQMTAPLTAEQTNAIKTITNGHQTGYLIQGVTGSGKTQVYIELAKHAFAQGKSVIVLVPEIALAPQITAKFQATFGRRVIASHSRQTEADRHLAWTTARSGGPWVVIGPRSSLFLPLEQLGLIVIDEAHETSYKQEQSPRYQTSNAAAKLAHLADAKLVLGSATPGLVEIYLAQRGRLELLKLTTRTNQFSPPPATVIDLRDKTQLIKNRWLSRTLLHALEETLSSHRQSLLFLNRRGSASSLICGDCGVVSLCPRCQLPLTFHADTLKLICHTCNYQITPPAVCPSCHSSNLRYLGGGTKRIEAEVTRLFPKARLARLDKDSATAKYIDEVHLGLNEGKIDILIGTQMIAKGLDLSRLDLVGVVSADTMLHLPDYTASERTFALLSQVSGRAGRGDQPGRVVIQTYTPDHPAITMAATANFDGFAASELANRRLLSYPPYVHLLKLSISANSTEIAQAKAEALINQLRAAQQFVLMGPAPAFRETAGGQHIWQVIVKSKSRSALLEAARSVPAGWTVDLDPVNLL